MISPDSGDYGKSKLQTNRGVAKRGNRTCKKFKSGGILSGGGGMREAAVYSCVKISIILLLKNSCQKARNRVSELYKSKHFRGEHTLGSP